MTVAELLDQYRRLAARHAAIDYGSVDSVRAGNRAADQLERLAASVASVGGSALADFATLLDDPSCAAWAAHHIIELMHPSLDLELRAVRVIESAAASDHVNAAGEGLWLKEWRSKRRPGTAGEDRLRPN